MSTQILYANTPDEVRPLVAAYYRRSRALQAIRDELEQRQLTGYLYGGAIRDLVVHGVNATPRDLDIVVEGDLDALNDLRQVKPSAWTKLPDKPKPPRGTGQGSDAAETTLRVNVEGMDVDIWHVSEQWSLPEAQRRIENVPGSGYLTTEAIVASFAAGADEVVVHDGGFMAAAHARRIDHLDLRVLSDDWEEQRYAVKAAVQSLRLGWEMTPRLRYFVVETLGALTVAEIRTLLHERYGTGTAREMVRLMELAAEQPVYVAQVVPPDYIP